MWMSKNVSFQFLTHKISLIMQGQLRQEIQKDFPFLRKANPSGFSARLFRDSKRKLGKSKEFSNPGIEEQFKRAKIQYQSRQTLHEIFFSPKCKCATGNSIPYFKIKATFSVAPYFPKNILTPLSGSVKWSINIELTTTLVFND